MSKSRLKYSIIIFSIVVLMLFIVIGYAKSDSVFYNTLLSSNKISNPVQVFDWAIRKFDRPKSLYVHPNLSPRYLIEKHKWLWCDEGAIVMATLDHQLGYKTRLIDLYGFDNIAHHTILEVLQGGKWVNYDFTFRFYNKAVSVSSDSCHFKLNVAKPKPYPGLYNLVINNNVFMKEIAFSLRGIKEADLVR